MNLLDATLVVYVREGEAAIPEGLTAWSRTNGYSRATVYRHLERIRAEGSWVERSRRPNTSPAATPAAVRRKVIAERKKLARIAGGDVGADVVQAHLEAVAEQRDWARRGWVVPARSTIHKILVAAGMVTPAPAKRPKKSYHRFCYARPRDCYQIDATDVGEIVGFPAVIMEILDDHSRSLVASQAGFRENGQLARAAFGQAVTEYGAPAILLSDNGLAFSDRFATSGGGTGFTRLVRASKTRIIHSSPHHPQTCGKVERHHQTFKKWLREQPRPADLAALQKLCDHYRVWYNTKRWHSVWRRTPQGQWDSAPELGSPSELPAQTDAQVRTVKVTAAGTIWVRKRSIYIGKRRKGDQLTIISYGDHVTVYDTGGIALGQITLDTTKRHQGRLNAA
jgi:Integrase core domain.